MSKWPCRCSLNELMTPGCSPVVCRFVPARPAGRGVVLFRPEQLMFSPKQPTPCVSEANTLCPPEASDTYPPTAEAATVRGRDGVSGRHLACVGTPAMCGSAWPIVPHRSGRVQRLPGTPGARRRALDIGPKRGGCRPQVRCSARALPSIGGCQATWRGVRRSARMSGRGICPTVCGSAPSLGVTVCLRVDQVLRR